MQYNYENFGLFWYEIQQSVPVNARTTNVVRNAGCARSRYTLKLSLIFLINQSIKELINSSVYLERLIRR